MKEGRDEERESWGQSRRRGGSPAVGGARGCQMSKTWCEGGGVVVSGQSEEQNCGGWCAIR